MCHSKRKSISIILKIKKGEDLCISVRKTDIRLMSYCGLTSWMFTGNLLEIKLYGNIKQIYPEKLLYSRVKVEAARGKEIWILRKKHRLIKKNHFRTIVTKVLCDFPTEFQLKALQ